MPIVIKGLSELSEMLTHESVRTAKRYLVNCAAPAAQVVVDAAEASAPVGATERLSHLIGYQTRFEGDDDGTTLKVQIGPLKGAQSHYGSLQEFGTRFQAAQHWLSRAWESCQDRCLSVFATEALARLADMEEKQK
ncbi:MAG TPA: HK97-gp10 family putative phage morphogenesis protein [Terriglobales bacterium]|nr:HK97-gp10 family putative phage morphogenesis protein [Terriglobales bacterium]